MKVPITIKTSYNTAKVPSLVDSGATDNFIHPQTVRQLCLGKSLLDKPKKLFNVDDTQNKAGSVTRYVDLSVTTNQKEQQMQFLVSDIGRESLILGYPCVTIGARTASIRILTGYGYGTRCVMLH